MRPTRILMVASEVAPFSKTGGLGDVAGALPCALGRLGDDVVVATPRYRGVAAGEAVGTVVFPLGDALCTAGLSVVPLGPGARALLVDIPALYDRDGLYGVDGRDFDDNPRRFAALTRAALVWAAQADGPPDVLHAHDWQAGLLPVYRRTVPPLAGVPCVCTIHNLAYQGVFDKAWMPALGLPWDTFTPDGLEYYNQLSFLKAGLQFSDTVTTVSPRYAEEIQTAEYGHGLDGVLRARRARLTGILNGIDTARWNPATDPHLPVPFSAEAPGGKRRAKQALLARTGLASDQSALDRPVVGMVTRLVEQKGLDLIDAASADLLASGAAFVVLGRGDAQYEALWRRLQQQAPDRIAVHLGFDESLAHLIEGGADLFLMPSRFEPCGLNQMYSQRYGTVPVVRETGGLADAVEPWQSATGTGTGFLFREYTPEALCQALDDALATYRQPALWQQLQRNGMVRDFSWDRSARHYRTVYKGLMAPPSAPRPRERRSDGR